MVLSDILTMLRLDLFDTTATRWSDADLQRAIAQAVARYSEVSPHIAFTDMALQPYQRTYPYPTSWHQDYPVLWIERVCYPLQIEGSPYQPPAVAPILNTITQSSGLSSGTYRYLVTFLSYGGETTPGPEVSITVSGNTQRVLLSALPTVPAGALNAANAILGRVIYRTSANGSSFSYLATIADNSSTGYTDAAADSSLLTLFQPPTVNTSGIMHWPLRERAFAQSTQPEDSQYPGSNGSIAKGASSFTLLMRERDIPRSLGQVMRVFYATAHQLTNLGSTIPAVHRDDIVLGAAAYALSAYQVPTNDNFAFQNGALYDRIDDTHIPTAWRESARDKQAQFIARLQEIRRQRESVSSVRLHWSGL